MRSNAEKQRIVDEAMVPGVSVAAVARRHGVNANLLFGWIRLHRRGQLVDSREPVSTALVPVTLSPSLRPSAVADRLEVDLPDGTRVRVYGSAIPSVIDRLLAAPAP